MSFFLLVVLFFPIQTLLEPFRPGASSILSLVGETETIFIIFILCFNGFYDCIFFFPQGYAIFCVFLATNIGDRCKGRIAIEFFLFFLNEFLVLLLIIE